MESGSPVVRVETVTVQLVCGDGRVLYSEREFLREQSAGEHKLFDHEADAWDAVATKLLAISRNIDCAIGTATARASAARVGQAVPS
jgi:hypothetical protein